MRVMRKLHSDKENNLYCGCVHCAYVDVSQHSYASPAVDSKLFANVSMCLSCRSTVDNYSHAI